MPLCLVLTVLLLTSGCGGSTKVSPTPTATQEPSPTPEPTIAGPTSIVTNLQTRCRLTDAGADLIVSYSAKVTGTSLQRVRLVDNGQVVNDSGSIARNTYSEEYTIKTDAGSRHSLEMQIEAQGSPPRKVQNIAVCPTGAAPSGPRA